jgi:Metal-dependent hydrolases of the beta-lactamase superfamily III
MEVIVLGSGTAVPSPGRSASGLLIRSGGDDLLLDLGPGVLARAGTFGVDPATLTLVLVSHLHSDHVLDLVTLIQAIDCLPEPRTMPMTIIGCRGTAALIADLLRVFPGIGPTGYRLDVREVRDDRFDLGPWSIRTTPTGHTPDSIAFRIDRAGHSVVYTGDAVAIDPLVALAHGADVLVSEASHPTGGPATDHLTPELAGRIARRAGVARLVLTHLYPATLKGDPRAEAAREYSGPIDLATDGLRVALA